MELHLPGHKKRFSIWLKKKKKKDRIPALKQRWREAGVINRCMLVNGDGITQMAI